MIISRTPYRISFFGGGTDFPLWYREHGGEVLSVALNRHCYLTCRKLPAFFEHKFRVVYSKIETCNNRNEIRHPAVRAVLDYLNIEEGTEIHHDGDLPGKSGIGSSSSFTVGLLNAMAKLGGIELTAHELALKSIYIEQDILKESVGCQDQVLAAYGGLNHTAFDPDGSIHVNPVELAPARLEELRSHLLIFYTGRDRRSSDIVKTYIGHLMHEKKSLLAAKDFTRAGLEILTSGRDLLDFGTLLHESWLMKSGWSEEVCPSGIRNIYETARSAGALGGKLTGAGGGGFLLLFAHPFYHERIREKLNGLLEVPAGFDFEGSRIIYADMEPETTEAYAIPET